MTIQTSRRDEGDEHYRELCWNGCEDILLHAAADKLFIFDCCYAASSVSAGALGGGECEVICASGFESIAPLPGPHSFTTALVYVLQEMAQLHRPFSVSAIYSRVLSRLKTLDPSQITLDGFRIAHAMDYTHTTQAAAPGGLLLRRRRIEYRRTPVHFVIESRLHHNHHQTFGIQLFPLRHARTQANDFVTIHEEPEPRVAKDEEDMMQVERALHLKVRLAERELGRTDVAVACRWLRMCPMIGSSSSSSSSSISVGEVKSTCLPQQRERKRDSHRRKSPTGFDVAQAIHTLERVEQQNEEIVQLVKATGAKQLTIDLETILEAFRDPRNFGYLAMVLVLIDVGIIGIEMFDLYRLTSLPSPLVIFGGLLWAFVFLYLYIVLLTGFAVIITRAINRYRPGVCKIDLHIFDGSFSDRRAEQEGDSSVER